MRIDMMLGNMIVANIQVKRKEVMRGIVRLTMDSWTDEKMPGIYPMKNSIKAHPAQNR